MAERKPVKLEKEIVKVEEQKKVFYTYKRVKLQHATVDGKTEGVFISTTHNNLYGGTSEIKYSEDEARTLLNILQTIFNEPDEGEE